MSEQLNIYRLSQTVNNDYDTYDSMVVAAENADIAKRIIPQSTLMGPGEIIPIADSDLSTVEDPKTWDEGYWANPAFIKVEYVGKADPSMSRCIICASFNAG